MPTAPLAVGQLARIGAERFVPRDVQVRRPVRAVRRAAVCQRGRADRRHQHPDSIRASAASSDFGQDYAGTGIALSGPYVYWTGQ